ncbi:MAG TPA: MerR family transcriptional regulator [Syntrophomonadaceae bacterium]|nr:MerR family transcriptional regulator [Syntrophomonadaceae bacterium]
MLERYFKIGEVSELLGIEQHTLRYLENSLKLKIRRNERGDREYSESDLETLKLVMKLRDKGLNTTAIRMALENAEPVEETKVVAVGASSLQANLPELLSLAQHIIDQNDEMIDNNKALENRIKKLEEKVEKRNLEREKKIDEFLTLWRNEQEGKSRSSWLSRLVGK